ncbi:MAG: DUF3822 family protein [Flavobacteriaceae bacterium]|nr:DUF3822 family protein [Flavobacteriaceae bacterium]
MSVQVTLTGLSFLITSVDKNVLFFTEKKFDTTYTPEELLLELKSTIASNDALNEKFDTVSLIYTTLNYSLVPTSLFDENKASEYLKFNTKILNNDFISYDEVDGQNSVTVYVPLININNFIFEQYGSFEYYHSSTLLVQSFLNIEKHADDIKVYLHILREQVDCVVISNGKLILCNSYTYKTPEDFIYYVLFCFEQLKLNPEKVSVILCGDISEESEIYSILYTYVLSVSFLTNTFPRLSEEEPQQHYLLKSII